MANKFGLGKGLGALIPQDEPPEDITDEPVGDGVTAEVAAEAVPEPEPALDTIEAVPNNQVLNIPVDQILPNPYQPRKVFEPEALRELSESIREHGILQPLIVTRRADGMYELISGERRLEASKLLGLAEVPAIIRYAEVADKQKLELALIENIQREDLNLIEQARAYLRLHEEFDLSYDEIADKIGKSRPAVSNIVRLLQLPAEVQRALIEGKIVEGHGRALLQVADRERQLALYKLILTKKLNTAQAMDIAKEWTARPHLRKTGPGKNEEALAWENLIKTKLGVQRVKVVFAANGGGRVFITFLNNDDFKGLVEKINSLE